MTPHIDEICKTCRHFCFNWENQPICAVGMNVYEFDATKCGDYERRLKLHEWM